MTFSQLEKELYQFLDKHCVLDQPLLLALSGGPDSLAMLHLLLKYKKKCSLKLAIAHVDHGWRSESAEEAMQLETFAKENNIPFHLKTLNPQNLQGNLEAASRQERILFFKELCQHYQYQAVLLAHHANDQAETVLKKVFEAPGLLSLAALREINAIQGVNFWRPWLKISKDQILNWLKQQQITFFEDRTNGDTRFLRGKFRVDMFPKLENNFGKKVVPSLCRLATDAQELKAYLDHRLQDNFLKICKGKIGSFLDLSEECPTHSFEMKYLIRKFCEQEGFSLTHELLEKAIVLTLSGKADRQIEIGPHKVYIDRRRLFALKVPLPQLFNRKPISLGTFAYGIWTVTVNRVAHSKQLYKSNWKEIWNDSVQIKVPENDYLMGPPILNASYPRTSSLKKWWTNHKVPAFLRSHIPVLWKGNHIEHEFLTGKSRNKEDEGIKNWLDIKLEIR